jgi:menaquinone-dependent protoporphyrinogen oxidase
VAPQKILIVYASRYGQTEKVAASLAGTFRSEQQVSVVPVNELSGRYDPARYSAVIVAGSVHFGKHQRGIRDFVRQHAIILATLPSAFVSVSGAGGAPTEEGRREAREYVERFLRETGWTPRRVAIFGGAVPYSRYGIFVRWFMKRLAVKRGRDFDTGRDYEYTDWAAVEQFAREFLLLLAEGRKIA